MQSEILSPLNDALLTNDDAIGHAARLVDVMDSARVSDLA